MPASSAAYQEKFVTARGLRFRYLEWGEPGSPEMVLLHGSGWSAHDWDFFAPGFQGEYHIFVPDQRGRGESEINDPPSFTTDDHVRDLAALVDTWGIDSFVLIGLSMGGHNALAYASRFPARVERLVNVDCGPSFSSWEGMWLEPPTFDSLEELVTWSATTFCPNVDMDIFRHVWEHGAQRLPDGRWLAFACPSLLTLDSTERARAWPTPDDLWRAIETVECPTLIVRGEEGLLTAADAARMQHAMPRARVVTIAGAGHTVPFDEPREFERAVREFLDEPDAV